MRLGARVAGVGAVPPAESPSTMNSSLSAALRLEQSASLPGMPALEQATCGGWHCGRSWRRRAPAPRLIAFLTTLVGLGGVLLEPLGEASRWWPSATSERISALPSLALVWPSNCGLRSFTEMIAVRPSRMSSPRRLSSFSLSRALARAYLLTHDCERGLEPLDVHPALGGGDAVGEPVDALVVAGVPLHRDVDI